MIKTLWVAWREFTSTVLTKGFILGIVLTPVLLLIVIGAMALLKNFKGPRIVGEIAVIDRTGQVAPLILERFDPKKAFDEEVTKSRRMMTEGMKKVEQMGVPSEKTGMAGAAMEAAAVQAAALGPQLTVTVLDPNADAEQEKSRVAAARIRTSKADDGAAPQRLALVVVGPDVLRPDEQGKFGEFQAYFPEKLDFEVQERVERRVGEAVVDARLTGDPRLSSAGLTPKEVRAMLEKPRAVSRTVSAGGEKKALGELRMLVPAGFMLLLLMAVMTSGQSLLTTTVEEKGSRVMEVLLSAASPMQIMVGKIIGQMGVGLAVLIMYSGLGIGTLVWFAQGHLIDPMSLVYLLIFFLIAYFLVASMMGAIGSAVNEMREAQTLMTPVMVLIMLPWMIWFLIQRAPNSTLATVLSFVPFANPFVMVIRLSGSEPVPAWQIPVSILVGIASVVFMAWAAAKIFRVGVLMYGKPPNFGTLVRWVRMA
jgi:ABC-type Na+ efflux pump permease subunit